MIVIMIQLFQTPTGYEWCHKKRSGHSVIWNIMNINAFAWNIITRYKYVLSIRKMRQNGCHGSDVTRLSLAYFVFVLKFLHLRVFRLPLTHIQYKTTMLRVNRYTYDIITHSEMYKTNIFFFTLTEWINAFVFLLSHRNRQKSMYK